MRKAALEIVVHAAPSVSVTSWESWGLGRGTHSAGGTREPAGDGDVTKGLHVTKGVVMWLYIFVTVHGTVPPGASSVKCLNLKIKLCGLTIP